MTALYILVIKTTIIPCTKKILYFILKSQKMPKKKISSRTNIPSKMYFPKTDTRLFLEEILITGWIKKRNFRFLSRIPNIKYDVQVYRFDRFFRLNISEVYFFNDLCVSKNVLSISPRRSNYTITPTREWNELGSVVGFCSVHLRYMHKYLGPLRCNWPWSHPANG